MKSKIPPIVLQWRELAEQISAKYEMTLPIILAMIWTESSGNPWATRYEPQWRYFWQGGPLYDKTKSRESNRRTALTRLGATEFTLQSTSLGLMQVMGAVARERGMKKELPCLYDPEIGIRVGCLHLSILLKRESGDLRRALDRYNGGVDYAEKVIGRAEALRKKLEPR